MPYYPVTRIAVVTARGEAFSPVLTSAHGTPSVKSADLPRPAALAPGSVVQNVRGFGRSAVTHEPGQLSTSVRRAVVATEPEFLEHLE